MSAGCVPVWSFLSYMSRMRNKYAVPVGTPIVDLDFYIETQPNYLDDVYVGLPEKELKAIFAPIQKRQYDTNKPDSTPTPTSDASLDIKPLLRTHTPPPFYGLYNSGDNACYQNSILQTFFYTPLIYNFAVTEVETRFNKHTTVSTSEDPAEEVAIWFEHLCHARNQHRPLTPERFRSAIDELAKTTNQLDFMTGRQADAGEFLAFIINYSFLSCFKWSDANEKYESVSLDIHTHRKRAYQLGLYLSLNVFEGAEYTEIEHVAVREISRSSKPSPFIMLSVKPKNNLSIEQGLVNRSSYTDITDYKCNTCPEGGRHRLHLVVSTWPTVLIVQLDRFAFNDQATQSVKTHDSILLDLSLYPSRDRHYQLYSIVFHFGEMRGGGHYIAWIRTSATTWTEFDDDKATPLSSNPVGLQRALFDMDGVTIHDKEQTAHHLVQNGVLASKQAYILFYQKV